MTENKQEQLENEADDFYFMANLFPKHTGLPFVVWVSERGGARHDVRVKVSPGPRALPNQLISVGIRPNVHVVDGDLRGPQLESLKNWIERNRQVILDYWDGNIDTADMIARLQKV